MNSLNLLSASVLGTSRPIPRRTHSLAEQSRRREETPPPIKRAHSHYALHRPEDEDGSANWLPRPGAEEEEEDGPGADADIKVEGKAYDEADEKAPLLSSKNVETSFLPDGKPSRSRAQILLQKISGTFVEGVKWIFGKIFAPGFYLIALFYTEDGHFSPLTPFYRVTGRPGRRPAPRSRRPSSTAASSSNKTEKRQLRSSRLRSASPGSSDSEADLDGVANGKGSGHVSSSDESTTSRRSIRIKQNEESVRRRQQKKKKSSDSPEEAIAKELKSPTSPASSSSLKLTRYPHAPNPPRPLIPRRQPSYSSSKAPQPTGMPQKTLVLDLDETLIHSMAKGGRMSRGHMVEVKLSAPAAYSGVSLGPQHPILYYVHKRPHCDEFLRHVSKWYNLVIFTASVQEYADPVIDWLELERKYFSARYYRQHCTFRNGAYIKDLGSIEPDLSKVMILDNSPLSYIFHEDNAIPIEGWINDPTDNDLMHLIPLFEGLQYVTDVRAFLGLRRGEIDQGGK